MSASGLPLPAHVSASAMEASLQRLLPTFNHLPSDSPAAFMHSAVMFVREWIDRHGEEAVKKVRPFAIVYAEPPAADGWEEDVFFRDDPDLDLGGKIAVTSTSMADVRVRSTDASRMKEIGQQLVKHNVGALPLLVVDAPRGFMFLYPEGVKGRRQQLTLDVSPITSVTRQTIDAELDEFHTLTTKYPDGYGHVWHSRNEGTLHSDAEAIVRDLLFIYFQWKAFRSQIIVREYQSTVGRPDICIFERRSHSAMLGRPDCVMELKVLRSRGVTKKKVRVYKHAVMERHARMGVSQAKKYKLAEKAPLAYLCLYDGRDSFSDLPAIRKMADEGQIIYKHYYMEKSTRDDLAAQTA